MRKIISRKGELRDYIGDIVIGVLCLLLIIFAVIIVYRIFANQESENAKRTIDNIEAKVNALNEGQENKFLIQGFSSKNGWIIAGWGKEDANRPDKCFFRSCLCICPDFDVGVDDLFGPEISIKYRNSCQEKGYCRFFEQSEVNTSTIYKAINYPSSPRWIHVAENLMEINISKQEDELEIIYEDFSTTA
jgi:hypothetical protein